MAICGPALRRLKVKLLPGPLSGFLLSLRNDQILDSGSTLNHSLKSIREVYYTSSKVFLHGVLYSNFTHHNIIFQESISHKEVFVKHEQAPTAPKLEGVWVFVDLKYISYENRYFWPI